MTSSELEKKLDLDQLNVGSKNTRSLYTVRQFSIKFPAFPEGGLRYLIFNENVNGFDKCIRRVGRKVLIDEIKFFQWIDLQNNSGGENE